MLHRTLALILLLAPIANAATEVAVTSPDGQLSLMLNLNEGSPTYTVSRKSQVLLPPASLGLTFSTGPLGKLELVSQKPSSHDETYPTPFSAKSSTARDHYNQTIVTLTEHDAPNRTLELHLRAYDHGVAFRYHLPAQPHLSDFTLTSEDTTFSLPNDATAHVLPLPEPAGHYEYLYQTKKVSDIKPKQLVGLPLLTKLPNGPYVAITEANLNDYPGMCLTPDADHHLHAFLTPHPDDKTVAVKSKTPHPTPWRVIEVADTPAPLLETTLVQNLNDPCELKDTSWIHPGKVSFLWWNGWLMGANGKPGKVDTATLLDYVNRAADLGFPYVSIDGLHIAWYGDTLPGDGSHDITTPVKEFDIQKVLARAKEKNIRIRLWLPSVAVRKQLDRALPVYEKWGIEGLMIDFVHRDDQDATNWMRDVVRKCADRHMTVTFHNCPKPTGLERTYPNLLTYEAVRNQEYDKWDPVGVPPDHNLTVPFTRMLAGPLDYHHGGFRSIPTKEFLPRDVAPDVMGTRCHQLALYVVYDDPMPMAVDYPAAYKNRPGTDFLVSVPTTWDQTKFLQGEVGQYISLARRKANDWYIGTMTNDTPRTLKLPLSFLPDGKFTATLWSDDPASGMNSLTKSTRQVTNQDTLESPLAPAGGQVIHLAPLP